MPSYKLTTGTAVYRIEDETMIGGPDAPQYDLYLAWLAEGNTPLPADPEPIPSVSMRQARLALLGAGLLARINDALSAMPGIEGEAARIEWEFATVVRRDSALVSGLSVALGLTQEQLDALFMAAAAL